MKSQIRHVNDYGTRYIALAFMCPGCVELVGTGLHMLAVNSSVKTPSWAWNGNLDAPTLNPSILTHGGNDKVCHSYLRDGVFEFLDDCAHSLAGKKVPMPDLPAWFIKETHNAQDS